MRHGYLASLLLGESFRRTNSMTSCTSYGWDDTRERKESKLVLRDQSMTILASPISRHLLLHILQHCSAGMRPGQADFVDGANYWTFPFAWAAGPISLSNAP